MNATITSRENNIVKFTFQAAPEKLEEGLQYAYNKNKKRISVPGFRKGRVPRKLIEAQYGEEFFYDDAINFVLNAEYENALQELELNVVSRPTVDVPKINKQEGICFEVEVTVKPDVTLGQYKGLEYKKRDIEVSEEEIEKELKSVQEKNARMTSVSDRAAQMGDVVTLSYRGTIDGVPFEGGTAGSYDLTLGSHTFIGDFEEQIAGHTVQDAFDVNVTFPEDYHEASLAGKPAVFAVEIRDISVKELAELNDEFAQDVSEYDTLEEYKNSIMEKLKATKESVAVQEKSDELVDKATANATMDVPEIMYENRIDTMVRDFEGNLSRQGLTLDMYCQYMNTTVEELRKTFRKPAERSVKARLALSEVVKAEGISVTDEEVEEHIEKMASNYGLPKEQMSAVIQGAERDTLKEDLCIEKAIKLIEESGVEAEA